MNDITYAVSVDVNNPVIPYNVYIASVADTNVRYLEVTLYENGNVIALSNTATATASLVTDNVLIDDSVECTISDNIITVPLEDLQRHGNLDVQVTVTEDTKVLAIPFPIQVRVTPNIAENAQINENSMGSYAEVVQEIAEARGSYDKLKDHLDHKANAADVTAALALKEDAANKKTSTTFSSADNSHYPSVGAVKKYLDAYYCTASEVDDELGTKADAAEVELITANGRVDANFESGYIETGSYSVGDTVSMSPTSHNNWKHLVVECIAGDVFSVRAAGNSGNRAWNWLDADHKLLSRSASTSVALEVTITAPRNAAYLLLNAQISNPPYYIFSGGLVKSRLSALEQGKANAADVAAKMADKMDNFPLPFLPVRVYKDQYCDGWVNWGDTTSPTYGDPHFSTLAGCTGFILPVKGHKGIMTWKVNTTKNNQVVVLNSNLKRVENKAPAIIGSIASLNLATDPNFKTKSFDYIAFATTDINSITFKEMLSSEGFYINPANTRYEIYNDEPVLAQFNPPYLYSDETPLYIYPQALFNRPFKMVSNPSGHNSLIQNGHDGFNLFNVTDLPTKTKVTIANGKKVLFIGDSYTNHRIYVKYVYDTITALNKEITLLGSWGEGVYRHEGRSGWRNYTFAKCSNQTDDSAFSGGTSIPNPFYNPDPSVKQFDFEFYVTNKLNGVCPDIVFVNLGANDISRGDYNTESDICEFVNIIVSSIKNYNSNIKVVYWLPNQFPIGINSGYDRWEGTTEYCRIIMNNYIELGIDELCPIRYAFDCYNDGRYVTQNINGHDMILLSDTTHPSELGYQHIGQMIIPYIHNY